MHTARRPTACRLRGCCHQWRRAAIIEMRSRPRIAQRSRYVEAARGITPIVMKTEASFGSKRHQLAAEGRPLGRARAVMDLEFGAPTLQIRDHRHDRSDANAAGDKQMALGRRIERE